MPKRLVTMKVYVPILAVVLLAAFPLAVFSWAILTNQDTGERLCLIVYAQIARSGATIGTKGSPGYDYYRTHPGELATARRQNMEFLAQLPCKGSQLRTERK